MKTTLNLDSITDEDAKTWLVVWKATGKSPATLALYATVVRQLTDFFGKPLASVTKLDAIAWLEDAKSRWQPGGVASRLKAIKAFWNWMIQEEVITRSPWKGLNMKVPNDPQTTATDDQVAAMLDGATRQEKALILTLADTGMRKDECANLELRDINIHGGTIDIRISKSRPRTVPMSDELVIAMQRWLRERGSGAGLLWQPKREAADCYSMIRTVLASRSGGAVTPHSLRRRFCIAWLLAGRSEASLARLMGWADTTMVAVYVKAAADEIAHREFRRFKDVNAA